MGYSKCIITCVHNLRILSMKEPRYRCHREEAKFKTKQNKTNPCSPEFDLDIFTPGRVGYFI